VTLTVMAMSMDLTFWFGNGNSEQVRFLSPRWT
jgi:hypothetical protein